MADVRNGRIVLANEIGRLTPSILADLRGCRRRAAATACGQFAGQFGLYDLSPPSDLVVGGRQFAPVR